MWPKTKIIQQQKKRDAYKLNARFKANSLFATCQKEQNKNRMSMPLTWSPAISETWFALTHTKKK